MMVDGMRTGTIYHWEPDRQAVLMLMRIRKM